MSEPLVCAIMLTKGRPAMARRAVECFRRQTYANKVLLVFDNGAQPSDLGLIFNVQRVEEATLIQDESRKVQYVHVPTVPRHNTIGHKRNAANDLPGALGLDVDILVHFDDDDWSHPNRIAEQVALLQASGADAVGYNEMLFWRTRVMVDDRAMPDGYGEAWLYRNTIPHCTLGTSLMYTRSSWEKSPFPGKSVGEDLEFCKRREVVSVSAMHSDGQPRMVASIHGGNSSGGYDLEYLISHGSLEWKRQPDWDDKLRGLMAL